MLHVCVNLNLMSHADCRMQKFVFVFFASERGSVKTVRTFRQIYYNFTSIQNSSSRIPDPEPEPEIESSATTSATLFCSLGIEARVLNLKKVERALGPHYKKAEGQGTSSRAPRDIFRGEYRPRRSWRKFLISIQTFRQSNNAKKLPAMLPS